MAKKVGVVIPTIREENIQRFLKEWETEFSAYPDLSLFVVEDNPRKSFNFKRDGAHHFSWEDIEREFGEGEWIIPRRTDCIRNFGYFKAWQAGVDVLITLDDDCYPARKSPYLIDTFVSVLESTTHSEWFNTLDGRVVAHRGLYPRGFPYEGRDKKVALCHGLWEHIPDFDGTTQKAMPEVRVAMVDTESTVIPHGILFPMCGMNVAIIRDLIPAFYFPLMGEDKKGRRWGIDRFGDIWAGLFIKKIIDHLDYAVVSGQPLIHHDRASDPDKNIKLEAAGRVLNEGLYREVMAITLSKKTPQECYRELSEKLPVPHPYFKNLKKAMNVWANLFQ